MVNLKIFYNINIHYLKMSLLFYYSIFIMSIPYLYLVKSDCKQVLKRSNIIDIQVLFNLSHF